MKTLKKVSLAVLALCIALCVSAFAACKNGGETEDNKEHTHVASSTYEYNEEQHWKDCTVEGCTEQLEKEAHSFEEWKALIPATCAAAGKEVAECSVCKAEIERETEQLKHEYEYTPAEDGIHHVGVCKNDAFHTVTEEHVYGEELSKDDEGHYYTCTVCGYKNVSEHSFSFDKETLSLVCECGYSRKAESRTIYANEDKGYGFVLNHNVKDFSLPTGDQEIDSANYSVDTGFVAAGKVWAFNYLGVDLVKVTYENGIFTIPSDYFDADTLGDAEFEALIVGEKAYIVTIKVTFVTSVITSTEEFNATFRDQKNKKAVYGYFVLGSDLDYEGNALPNHSGGLSYGMLSDCAGLVGTFDGRDHTIKNFNTANPFGLFVKIAAGNGTTIKNLNFTDLVHDGALSSNVFGWMVGKTAFENIEINVKSSKAAATFDDVTGVEGLGFLFNMYADANTYKNITINAEGQKIYSLFGSNVKAFDENVLINCFDFAVNAKKVYYLGKIDGGEVISADTEVAGLTLNQTSAGEISEEVYETGKTSFLVDLGVENVETDVNGQTVSGGNITLAIGDKYGTLVQAYYNGTEIVGATYDGGVLTLPVSAFSAAETGERTIVVNTEAENNEYELTVHVLVATKVIKTTNDFQGTFRDQKNKTAVYGYFVLGNDLDYEGKALPNHSGGDSELVLDDCAGLVGTFDGRGYTIKNFNTGNKYGLFGKIAYGTNSVIKNVNFTDLVHAGTQFANIFGFSIGGATFENITINVKSSAVVDGLTMSTRGMGFICGTYMDKCTFKNITVNAEGQEIYSLFGYWCKRASATAQFMTCENVVVNAKKVYYLGREDGNGDKIIYDVETYGNSVAGLTVNLGR